MDGSLEAIQGLIDKAQREILFLEPALLETRNERQCRQLKQDLILQAELVATLQMEMRSLRNELASERVPPPVQTSMTHGDLYPEQEELPATPPANCPAFGRDERLSYDEAHGKRRAGGKGSAFVPTGQKRQQQGRASLTRDRSLTPRLVADPEASRERTARCVRVCAHTCRRRTLAADEAQTLVLGRAPTPPKAHVPPLPLVGARPS
ncbi:hypothetical protein MRX96_031431 [Rhipicephalus microplus]